MQNIPSRQPLSIKAHLVTTVSLVAILGLLIAAIGYWSLTASQTPAALTLAALATFGLTLLAALTLIRRLLNERTRRLERVAAENAGLLEAATRRANELDAAAVENARNLLFACDSELVRADAGGNCGGGGGDEKTLKVFKTFRVWRARDKP